MPVKKLAELLQPDDSGECCASRAALPYRDFMTAGLLVKRMRATGKTARAANNMPPDNWIYVQEPDVKLGRLQIFNNWSPYLWRIRTRSGSGSNTSAPRATSSGRCATRRFLDFAAPELAKIGLIDRADVLDGTVVRVPKAYPAYFGEYRGIGQVRAFLDEWTNLFPVGRNGMHRYNNQDHSMLAAQGRGGCDAVAGSVGQVAHLVGERRGRVPRDCDAPPSSRRIRRPDRVALTRQ